MSRTSTTLATLAAAMVLGGCGAAQTAASRSSSSPAPSTPTTSIPNCRWSTPKGSHGVDALSYCLNLERDNVPAGGRVNGTLTIKNPTNTPIAFTNSENGTPCAIRLDAVLRGHGLVIKPKTPADCRQPEMLQPGINRMPLTVTATYTWCTTNAAPKCEGSRMPSLPTGRYQVTLAGDSFSKLAPVTLTIT